MAGPLHFSNGSKSNGLKTGDKISLSPEAAKIQEATDRLFEQARKLGHAKNLKFDDMDALDKKIEAEIQAALHKVLTTPHHHSTDPNARKPKPRH